MAAAVRKGENIVTKKAKRQAEKLVDTTKLESEYDLG